MGSADLSKLWEEFGPLALAHLAQVAREAERAGLVAGEPEDWVDTEGPSASVMLVEPPRRRHAAPRRPSGLGVATVSVGLRSGGLRERGGAYIVAWKEIRGEHAGEVTSETTYDEGELAGVWEEMLVALEPRAYAKALAEEVVES